MTSLNPTEEQAAIIHAATSTSDNLMLNALAGTGKSSTLKMIDRAIKTKPALYLVFNRRNAYEALPEPLRKMEGSLGRLSQSLAWIDPETKPLAEHIWELIARRPQALDSLWRRVNYSSLTFLEAVRQLVSTGQAEILTTAPSE